MKKLSSLINQVEMFEKLAVYGSRSVFLKSLAQANDLSSALESFVNSIHEFVNKGGIVIPELQNHVKTLSDAFEAGTSDPKTLQSIHQAATIISTSGLLGSAGKAAGAVAAATLSGEVPDQTFDFRAPAQSAPSFPKRLQRKLNDVLVDPATGLSLSPYLKEDGILGPDTKRSLDKFRAIVQLPVGTSISTITNVLENFIPGSEKPAVNVDKLNEGNPYLSNDDSESAALKRDPAVDVSKLNRISPLPKL